ncbi:hypothetical protein ACWZEH_21175 [Streptomyces sp. QTS137]
MSRGVNGRLGKAPVVAGNKRSKATKQLAQQQEDLRRRRAQQELEFARDAERRRDGLGAAPARTEKPASPSKPEPVKPPRRKRKKASATSLKSLPATRPAPIADRGVERRNTPPKVAPAYMRLTPEEKQRERRVLLAREKREAERIRAKKKAQLERKRAEADRRAKTSGTGSKRTRPGPVR